MEVLEKPNNVLTVDGGHGRLGRARRSWCWLRANVCLRIFQVPYRGAYEIVSFLGAVVTAFALGFTQMTKSQSWWTSYPRPFRTP